MNKKRYLTFAVTIFIFVGLIVAWLKIPKPDLLTGISFSTAIYDDHQRLLRLTLTPDEKYRLLTPISAINPVMIQATLLKEDTHFYQHDGVNIQALVAAFWQTYIKHGHRRGASTITMQVARLRYQLNSHQLSGKIKQIFLALQIERYYNKEEILEAYLNLAPYGNNIEGVGAAALIYYHQPASNLTLPQALTLSVIPQNPGKRSLDHFNYDWIKLSRLNLFQRWLAKFPEHIKFSALVNLPLINYTRQQLPFQAPHFVNELLQKNIATRVEITLDLNLQKVLEKNITQYIALKNNLGIHNAAALLVDTTDMSVKASAGSANFFNKSISGEVNGTLAKRSPGSALKPFIYALAIDQGLIHPATILKDTPMSFGTYDPENFDYVFLGPVSAKDALVLSRNIPAIYLESQLKYPSFYEFLLQSGMSLKNEKDYGLSIVLGGAEITMQHVAELYAMLANKGVYHTLRFMKNEKIDQGKRLLSPEASFLVLDMLQSTPRPNRMNLLDNTTSAPVSWKTGTSSAYRDAWAVGVFGHYVLAVWVGNFSGKGNPAFTGHEAAAPLFFRLIEGLSQQLPKQKNTTDDWNNLNLAKVDICTASGMLPTHACPRTHSSWFIPGKSPIQKDTVYREIMINPQTGLRTCHFDPDNRIEVFEFWSSDLLKIFQQAGIQRRSPPPYEKNCQLSDKIIQGMGPHISSPRQSIHYAGNHNQPAKILLEAITDADVDALHWFANETYLGKSEPHQMMWWHAKPGHYTVRVIDNYGRADAVDTTIVEIDSPPLQRGEKSYTQDLIICSR